MRCWDVGLCVDEADEALGVSEAGAEARKAANCGGETTRDAGGVGGTGTSGGATGVGGAVIDGICVCENGGGVIGDEGRACSGLSAGAAGVIGTEATGAGAIGAGTVVVGTAGFGALGTGGFGSGGAVAIGGVIVRNGAGLSGCESSVAGAGTLAIVSTWRFNSSRSRRNPSLTSKLKSVSFRSCWRSLFCRQRR
jgi:hypothetical protein